MRRCRRSSAPGSADGVVVEHIQHGGCGFATNHDGGLGRRRAVAIGADDGSTVRTQCEGGFAADAAAAPITRTRRPENWKSWE